MAIDTTFLGKTNAEINEQLMTAQQRLAYAQALRGQSLQPIQAPGGQNGRISPLSALAQALSGYAGNQKMQGATHDLATAQAAQAQNQWGYMKAAADAMADAASGGGGAPTPAAPDAPLTSTPQASVPSASAQALSGALQNGGQTAPAATPPSPAALGIALQGNGSAPDMRRIISAANLNGMMGNEPAAKFGYDTAGQAFGRQMDRTMPAPTDIEKQLISQGVQRGSPQWNQALSGAVTKANYIAPVQVAPGTVALDPATNRPLLQNPKLADGMRADFASPLAPTASAIPGYAQGNAANVGAARRAEQSNTVFTSVPGEGGAPISGYGGSLFGGGGGSAAGAGGAVGASGAGPATAAPAPTGRPGTLVGADPTIQTARTNQQNNLADKWKPLNEAVSNAQTINSRLDTIQELATRASTGQFADKLQYVNSLLSMAGSEKATDATTAKALLDKNANQIVALLGQGGLATDAARSIISSAYPNSHMPGPAIKEAAENLKAANAMQVAKAGVLQKHYLNNDPASYQQAESQFNAVADPRVFQWYSMHDPQQQAEYAKRMMAQDPTFRSKVEALTKLGALK